MTFSFEVDELDKSVHDRSAFDCGTIELNEFLHKRAVSNRKLGINKTLVLTQKSNISQICAYFTIASTTLQHEELPIKLAKKLPLYPIPVILIAQLAVDSEYQGQGVGSTCLISAMKYAYEANHQIPAYAIVVDAIDNEVKRFYEKYGFLMLSAQHQNLRPRLFMPIKDVNRLFIN